MLSAMMTPAAAAFAQSTSETSPDDRRQAAQDFAEGDRAFKTGDYRGAAEAYERAYRRVPHHSALWNAARAWHRAGELTRAANLYARYLREAPPNSRDRDSAQRSLNEISSRLARLEIHATDVGDVRVDGQPLEGTVIYVTPGAHVVEGHSSDEHVVRQEQNVRAGDTVSVALVPPNTPTVAAPTQPPSSVTPPPKPNPATEGWAGLPKWTIYGGAGLTAVLAGLTVASGIDTNSQKTTFTNDPTQSNLDSGLDKEHRTNILLGITGGVAALTAVAAIFFVDWEGAPDAERHEPPPQVMFGVGPGSMMLRGEF